MTTSPRKDRLSSFFPLTAFICFAIVAAAVYNFAFAWASVVSIGLLTLGALLILGLHILTPNLDPLNHFVSEYSLSRPYGILMRTAFYAIAIATFNLSFLLPLAGMNGWMRGVVLGAGVFTTFMGIFSQKSSSSDDIQNTVFEGVIHSISASGSFGLATVSMLIFACWPPEKVIQTAAWSRAVALSLFGITLVAVLVQVILGARRIEMLTKRSGLNAPQLVSHEVRRRLATARRSLSAPTATGPASSGQAVQPSDLSNSPQNTLSESQQTTLVHANQGLGLSERILIFLFLEWEIILSVFTYSLLKAGG